MRNIKGIPGYIKKRKKNILIKNIIEFGIVIALVVLGYIQTKTRMNLLTVVAVVGCLPAGKALVELIMIWPHRSISKERAEEIQQKTSELTVIYDLVLTSEKNIMPIECLVISNNTICGYVSNPKTDRGFASSHIAQMLEQNKFGHVVVKLFDNYTAFITRAEGMNNIAEIEKADTVEKEKAMGRLILNISL